MKKGFIYTLALAAVSMTLLPGCSNTEDMIFDSSAAERLDEARADYINALCSDGGKWVMEYFANDEMGGVNYVMTFDPSGSVTMATANYMQGFNPRQETSLWDIVTDNGAVLTFNTYNSLFHIFSQPDLSQGQGYLGDYEFVILGVSKDRNTITLKGKKGELPIVMRRLSADTDVMGYVEAFNHQGQTMFNAIVDTYVMTYGETGERFIAMYYDNYGLDMYPESGDKVTQTEYGNIIISADGFRFMRPLYVSTGASAADSISVKSFKLQPDGTLVCDDPDDKGTTIVGLPLGTVLSNKNYAWGIDRDNSTGKFATLFNDLLSDSKAASGTLQDVKFPRYDEKLDGFVLEVLVKLKKGAVSNTKTMAFAFTAKATDKTIKYTYKDRNSDARDNIDKFPSVQALVDFIGSQTFNLSAANMLAPANMVLTSEGGDKLIINVQ